MSFEAGAVTATLELDRSPFIRSLSAARRDAARFAKSRFEATLKGNVNPLQGALRSARASLEQFSGGDYSANLGADATDFRAGVLAAERLGANFAGKTYQAELGVKGTAESVTELKGVDTVADRLDGRNVSIDVDADLAGHHLTLRRIQGSSV